MGPKSRGNWLVEWCIKECANKNVACKDCIRFSLFIPLEDNGSEKS